MWRTICLIVTLCAVTGIDCRRYYSDRNVEYLRSRRAKYNPPLYSTHKFYNRPSYNRGPYQYSPSHGYSTNDIGPQIPSKPRPYKVSKRPFNEGLGDEGFQSVNQYLSNNDLDKIIELAIESERQSNKYLTVDPLYNDEFNTMHFNNNENNIDLKNIDYEDVSSNIYNGLSGHFENKYPNVEYQNTYSNYPNNYVQGPSTVNGVFPPIPISPDVPIQAEKFSLLDAYIQKEANEINQDSDNFFTDGLTMQEERLPLPINLRNDDYDVSFSHNAPAVVKPESSYQLESFADLPLMGFENSKLETVNSYSVPQYTVVSTQQQTAHNRRPPVPSFRPLPPSSSPLSSSVLTLINAPIVEPAPPPSVAISQSDAHLKATNIWTHKSKGTAYTLHDDGTLSLERPSKPKYKYP